MEKADSFKPVNQPEAIGFDERKDESKCVVGVGQSGHKRFEKKVLFTWYYFQNVLSFQEEHCAIIVYHGDELAGHVVPPAGTGEASPEEIGKFIQDIGVEMQKVKSLVGDGCEKMVGWEKGVHAS